MQGERVRIPPVVREVYELGLTPIPIRVDKSGAFKWKRYQQKRYRPERSQIKEWAETYENWAVITGQRNGLLVLDFDGPEGERIRRKLGLKPHIKTPSGGSHVWVHAPDYLVQGKPRIDPERLPNMDLKAAGMLATIAGKRGGSSYRRMKKKEPYRLEELPKPLRKLIEKRRLKRRDLKPPRLPKGFKDFTHENTILGEALQRVGMGDARNETGFWMARQLRDERRARSEAEPLMYEYADKVTDQGDHPYTRQEAYDSLISAYSQPPRPPRQLKMQGRLVLASEVEPKKVEWLWLLKIPLGMISEIQGDPEQGKSLLTLDVGARVSRGRRMPDGTRGMKGSVLIACAEDTIDSVVVPRLMEAKADLDRIGFIRLQTDDKGNIVPLSIPEDLKLIRETLDELHRTSGLPPKLLIIDPVTAYLSDRINTHHDGSVRRAMWPLADMADKENIAVLNVRHMNKNGDLRAMYRGGGSIAINAATRSVMVSEFHPDDRRTRILARLKNNIAPPTPALTFQVVAQDENSVPRIDWGETMEIDVETLLHGADKRLEAPSRLAAARDLADILSKGPVEWQEIRKQMEAAGHSWSTVKRAKKELGIVVVRERGRHGEIKKTLWQLPIYGNTVHFDFGS